MDIGYRGGLFRGNRLANNVASSSLSTHLGCAYLCNLGVAGNVAVFEDNVVQAEGSGSSPKIANINGNGNVTYLNRQGTTATAIDNPGGCPIVNETP
jgi:type V secretory pathway adhesin AidA